MNNHTSDNSVVTPATTTSAPVAATGMPPTAPANAEAAGTPSKTSPETPPPVAPVLPALPPTPPPLPDHTARLDYELVLRGGRDEILHVKSELTLPLALEPENLAQTDLAFPELVDRVIISPMVARFRNFLQMRYDVLATAAQGLKAAAQAPTPGVATPPPASVAGGGFKLPTPDNGAAFVQSTPNAKLPTPKMPGGSGHGFSWNDH